MVLMQVSGPRLHAVAVLDGGADVGRELRFRLKTTGGAAPGLGLVFDYSELRRWDLEELAPLATDLLRRGELRSAPAALRRGMGDDLVGAGGRERRAAVTWLGADLSTRPAAAGSWCAARKEGRRRAGDLSYESLS